MSSDCPNCGEPVDRNYCPACGQATRDRRRSLSTLLGEFFTEFFSLDGRHLRTAALLAAPGRLTRLYLEGKRASLVSPVRVYLVASLLFFLLVGVPVPDATKYNVYVDEMLIGRDQPDPQLGRMQLLALQKDSVLSKPLEASLQSKVAQLQSMTAQDLLDGFFSGLEQTVPTALICFVPILAVALKLLYVRRSFFYVDHLVFALHFQSFLFMLMLLVRLLNVAGLAALLAEPLSYLLAAVVAVPAYLLLALRRVYEQSWLRTAFKCALLGLLYLLLIQPVMLVTFYLVLHRM